MAVFAGRRLYDNNVQGTTTDNPLTNVATTLNSAGLANLSAVASNHAVIVLDPLRAAGAPEIVIVTAHTGAATSATISRGAYGTAARQHAAGTLWVHPVTKDELIQVLTATPTDVFEGQLWYRSDTNVYAFSNGTDVSPMQGGGTLGYAQVVANQGSITSSVVDLTGLSVAVTVGTGRRIKITATVGFFSDTNDRGGVLYIREGSTTLQQAPVYVPVLGNVASVTASYVTTPTAGAHTYKLSALHTISGTTTMFAASTLPAFILVEDIGV